MDVADFARDYPPAHWWATASREELMDESPPDPELGDVDCYGVSQRFAEWLNARGVAATVVQAEDADYDDDPMIDIHRWVVADGVAYDWTVRQYGTLLGPGAEQALRCAVPLTWPADQPHPIVRFRTVEPVT